MENVKYCATNMNNSIAAPKYNVCVCVCEVLRIFL